jgi:hypothetical protein
MSGDDLVHEVEELDPSASLVVPAGDFAAGQIKGRKERRRGVPRIVVGLARHGAPAFKVSPFLASLLSASPQGCSSRILELRLTH